MIIPSETNPVSTTDVLSKKEKEQPPAYSEDPSGPSSSFGRRLTNRSAPPALPAKDASYFNDKLKTQTTAAVSQMHMHNHREPITGTFHIDPKYPSCGYDTKGDMNWKEHKKNPPDASFRTRKAPINMELGTTGEQSESKAKAKVYVSSHKGDITIKLLSTPLTAPRLGLEVSSWKGNITVMLPNDFFGCIELKAKKGTLQFLPALAASMRTMKKTSDEALIMVGQPTSNKEVDFLELQTRAGKITVGISGLDRLEAPKGGFWRRLTGGSSTSAD